MAEPDIKRRKTEISDGVIEDVNTCLIEKLINDMRESTDNLSPILPCDVTSPQLSLKEMHAATILEKRLIYKVIMKLNEILPISECQYLKRVKGTEVLLCSSTLMSQDEVRNFFIQNDFNFGDFFVDNIKTVQVVSSSPVTKLQYDNATEYWPCNFHPNKQIELQLSGKYFDAEEIKKHRKYMKLAFEVAEMYEDKHDREVCSASALESINKDLNDKNQRFHLIEDKETIKKKLRDLKGAVVVDPSIDSIVAVGYDRRKYNPSQHPVMIAVDNVARSQNGGVWYDDSMAAEELPCDRVDNLLLDGVPKMFRNILNATYDDLKFGARPSRRRECVLAENNYQKMETNDVNCAGEKVNLKRPFDEQNNSPIFDFEDPNKASGPYLCTGYDIYVTNEPCLMCSMALVHSRVRRVFFAIDNEDKGALGSNCKLHTVSYLNHRFEVFTGFFREL